MFRIYKIQNINNNKIYIGKTSKSIEERWRGHIGQAKSGRGTYFHKAIRKHGIEAFKIEEIDITENELNANWLESFYIGLTKSYNPTFGYNGTFGGDGHALTDEVKARIGAHSKGRKLTEEQKQKISQSKKGKYVGVKSPFYGKKRPVYAMRGLKEYWKQRGKTAEVHPRWRKDIDEERLKTEYLDCKNTTEVGRRLNIPQPTVHKRLKRLGLV